MSKLTFLFGFALLISCQKPENKTGPGTAPEIQESGKGPSDKKITFYKVNSKAILLGKDIRLLDENFRQIKDISSSAEKFVEISEVSNEYQNEKSSDDRCQEFKYVRIKTKDFEGYVDGRKLYEPVDNTQNKTVKIDDNEVSLIASNHFGIAVSDDDGLTGCPVHTPAIFSDKNAKFEGVLKLVKSIYYTSNYPYFELKENDGAVDEIVSIEKAEGHYLVKIKRSYQEGGANLLVSIYRKNGDGEFVAEVIDLEETEE